MSTPKMPGSEISSAGDPRIGALLRRAWLRVREHIYHGVHRDGFDDLNPAHVALFRYEGLEGKRPKQLSEQLQITKQSVHELLRHLEQHGYAETRPDPTDKRSRLIRLTARGKRLEASVLKYARSAEREIELQLGPDSFREFSRTLQLLASSGRQPQ